MGYKIGIKNRSQITKSTFKIAYQNRLPSVGLMFHSDNVGNYRFRTFQNYLKLLNIIQSFSRPYVPYDNSVMESFFAPMKREELYRRKYKSEKDLYKSIEEYIVLHAKNNYKTPLKKEQEYYSTKQII